MVFRARKSVRVLAAAGAAATPSFGVGTTRAAAASPVKTPAQCGMRFDRVMSTDAMTFRHCSEAGVVTTIDVPAA
jgi:hypothetical protein